MAKTKTKEETVNLKPEKVTEVQLKKIQTIVDRTNFNQMQIGQLEARKHQLLHMLAGINDELGLMQKELQDQYGTNDIDIISTVLFFKIFLHFS